MCYGVVVRREKNHLREACLMPPLGWNRSLEESYQ